MNTYNKTDIMEHFTSFFADNAKSRKIVVNSIIGIGLGVSILRSRAFIRFKEPLQVPSKIINKNVQLRGTVKNIDPTCGILLLVDHKPPIALPRLSRHKYLPIKLAGINVTTNGMSWLQTVVNNKEIKFVPLAKTKEYLDCIVLLLDENKVLNVGEELTKLGFATLNRMPLPTTGNKQTVVYQKTLQNAEKEAKWRRNGYWHFALRPTLLWRVDAAFNQLMREMLLNFKIQQSKT